MDSPVKKRLTADPREMLVHVRSTVVKEQPVKNDLTFGIS